MAIQTAEEWLKGQQQTTPQITPTRTSSGVQTAEEWLSTRGDIKLGSAVTKTAQRPAPTTKTGYEIEKLTRLAESRDIELPKERGPGTLSRIFGFLSAAETAPAAYEVAKEYKAGTLDRKDIIPALKKYGQEAKKGATLKGLDPEKKTYSDVLEVLGMPKGKIAGPISARGAAGLAGDVLLDPTTYVGAGIIKQLGKGAGAVLKPLTKIKKVEEAADLFGKLFKSGYDVRKLGKPGEEYLTSVNKLLKGTRGETEQAVEGISQLAGETTGKYGKGAGDIITNIIETGKKSTDEPLNQVADMMRKTHGDFAKVEKKRGLLKTDLPNYLRHYLTEDGKKFIDSSGSQVFSEYMKPFRASLQSAKGRKLKGTVDEINKYFKKEHGVKLFEPDAFKAFAGRTVEHIKAIKMHDFLTDAGKRFGIAAPEGSDKILRDGIMYTKSTAPQLKNTLLPEAIAKHVDETTKILSNDEATNMVLRIYDNFLGFFKGSVTGRFPAFHGRNLMGGVFNNYIAGVKNPIVYKVADDIIRGKAGNLTIKGGKKIPYDEIRKILSENNITGQSGFFDVFKTVESRAKDIGKSKLRKGAEAVVPGRKWMEFVEDHVRVPLLVDSLQKGDVAENAVKKVYQFHFDYAPEAMTAFERQVMKRLIPFYTWTRNNIPLQLKQMAKQPGKYAGVAKFFRSLKGEDTQGEEYLPEYMKEKFPIKWETDDKGLQTWLYGLGLPIEDLGEVIGETPTRTAEKILSRFSPLLIKPLEVVTGRHFYFGKPLGEVDYVYPFVADIPGMKKFLDLKEQKTKDGETYYITPKPELFHLATLFFSRYYVTYGKLTKEDMQNSAKMMYALLGMKVRTVDPEREKYFREKDREDQLEKYLEKQGVMRKFENYYVPKN